MAQLYAIAANMERARFMLEAGAPVLQLRFKEERLAPHREEIAGWPRAFPNTRLIINDDLPFAQSVGAWGVHLGQEDLTRYSRQAVVETPLQLGISTHSDAEIQHALGFSPGLLGFGPIFPTATKETSHPPQGIARLREAVQRIALPLIAIGGIGGENLDRVVESGVAYVAMISYLDRFTTHAEFQALISRLEN